MHAHHWIQHDYRDSCINLIPGSESSWILFNLIVFVDYIQPGYFRKNNFCMSHWRQI